MSYSNVTEQQLLDIATSALSGFGLAGKDASDAARILVYADMFGIHTHGVERIFSYGRRLKIGGIKANPNITATALTPSIISVDGDNGLGPLVGMRALQAAMEAVRTNGLALALVKGSNHFGPICPYSYIAAKEGFATLIGSNATTTIAPWGGSEAKLGNNPFGFGLPNPDGDPFMLDMAMSVVARAKIRSAAKAGERIPDSWATDRDGNPTTDPAEALGGFLQPVGGHKGYGLALVVDLIAGLLFRRSLSQPCKIVGRQSRRATEFGTLFHLDRCRTARTVRLACQSLRRFYEHPPRHHARVCGQQRRCARGDRNECLPHGPNQWN